MTVKPKYYLEAERLLGLKEIPGKQHNQEIVALWRESGMPQITDDETPWCMAFVNGCLVRGNKAGTKSGLARSPLYPEHKDKFEKLDGPELYSIGVMKRGNSSWQGHVGFVADFNDKYVWLLGGNQGNAVSIARYPRSAFSGSGLGFVRPTKSATDVPLSELKEDSRALKASSWFQRITLAVSAGATAAFNFINDFKTFVDNNTGLVLLAVIAVGLLAVKTWDYFTINAYQEGRYLPKSHEEDYA